MTGLVLGVLLVVAVAGASRLTGDLRTLPGPSRTRGRADVAVVVPARDEEGTLPDLLGSLARSRTRPREVVVVDDGSQDRTAAVARDHGARVLPAGGPPPGWTGKAWACDVGARGTAGDVLLFLDADTRLGAGALDALLDLHERAGGLVSVQPHHRTERPYEQLSAYFNAVSVLASGAFGRRPARHPMAFGPCLLTTRADYDLAGGHRAVRGEVLDDVALGAAYQRAGLPVRCAVGAADVQMRSYPGGLRQLAAGWTKNFASGAAAAAPLPLATTVLWLAVHHAVAVGALRALVTASAGPSPTAGLAPLGPWAVGWVVVAWQLRSTLRPLGTFRWWTWALFPLPLLVFDLVFARSLVHTAVRRSVRWRGRDVDLRRRDGSEESA